MLESPVTAQYTHTLTVTGRLGGQYQCNVTNNKPSTATAQCTVQGNLIRVFFTSLGIPILPCVNAKAKVSIFSYAVIRIFVMHMKLSFGHVMKN